MSASPILNAAFNAWKLAELAMHYAAPCPDEVMNHLCEQASVKFDALMAAPIENADDMLLKMFPLLLRDMEAPAGAPPLRPADSRSYKYDRTFYNRLIDDLGAASPLLREAIATPYAHGRAS